MPAVNGQACSWDPGSAPPSAKLMLVRTGGSGVAAEPVFKEGLTVSAVRVLPWSLHVALEYLGGIFLVLSPFLFGFTDSSALPVLLGTGVVILAVAVLSRGRMGIAGFLPVKAQATVDYLLAFFLMVAPFAFGYRDHADALVISVMVGLGLLVVSLLTRYPSPPAPAPTTAEPPAGAERTDAALEPPRPARDTNGAGTAEGSPPAPREPAPEQAAGEPRQPGQGLPPR